jgi:dolichol-phosphate mannosyltransferase
VPRNWLVSLVMGARVWLVIPTYNESANIEAIVEAAREVLPPSRRVLIVDDSSPDGTGAIADRLAEAHDDVEVLHRPAKAGLGPAYVAGFRTALDFSHDPQDLPRLLEAAEDADLVLGSRYVRGGGVTDWGAGRRAVSRWGSAYARTALGLRVQDLTGGFKVFRREVLESIDLESLASVGYAFQVETTYRALRAGFRVVEVPILFRDRRVGESKMSGGIVLEAAWRVAAMRMRGR